MRRTGIDLSSAGCIVVEAETSGRRRKDEPGLVRVRRFTALPSVESSQALTAELKVLVDLKGFPKRAWVNLWGVQSSHEYRLMPSARASEFDSMARHHGAAVLGMNDADVTVATTIGSTRGEPGHHPKTEVSYFAAGSHDIRQRLRPIVAAGFVVEGVTTPCGALWSQARLRRPPSPGEVHAHVVLGVSQSALGIFSNGALLYARDLDWGYAAATLGVPVPLEREELAGRLSLELRRSFLYLKQYWEEDVSQVLLCGDMPGIRSLTAPLIERLNIEVETLDTLEGIETTSVPDGFAEQVATFRLASSIAAEPPPVNLLPPELTTGRTSKTGWRIFAVATATAIAFGAFLFAQASVARTKAERQLSPIQREMSRLEPSVTMVVASQPRPDVEAAQRAALRALDEQGPAMARLLEVLTNATPNGVTVRSMRALPDGEHWNVTIEAFAAGSNAAQARSGTDSFLRRLEESPIFGEQLQPPMTRLVSGARGIELAATYRVRK